MAIQKPAYTTGQKALTRRQAESVISSANSYEDKIMVLIGFTLGLRRDDLVRIEIRNIDLKHHPKFDPPIHLVGGMFSCHGKYSFRGKVYSDIIEKTWGCGLYLDEIPNKDILEIALSLENADYEMIKDCYPHHTMSKDEFFDLKRMFRAYADAGASLLGWY